MLLRELFERQVYAKRGNTVVRKYRCTSGARKGRVVTNVGQCFAPPDIAKRNRLRITKARLGSKMVRKAKRTKRTNPASIRVRAMNR
jgi:hypothetical protein|tara:strand:+ start:1813 stop:2073 length:261 start_codon:yes stop_codon:yes gene_type:complete